jgi:hypothetical protein
LPWVTPVSEPAHDFGDTVAILTADHDPRDALGVESLEGPLRDLEDARQLAFIYEAIGYRVVKERLRGLHNLGL